MSDKLKGEPWTASWITARDDCHPVLCRRFQVRSEIKSALLHVSGVGMFEAYLNGEKLGDEFFAPYFTDYETEIQALTYEMNGLHPGENTLEILLGNDCFYNGNYRGAKAAFSYISNGEPETVRAHFSFWGFRYVKLTGVVGEIRREDFTGKVLYSDLPRTGWFECGDVRVNRVYKNTLWSMESNFLDIPTDCPQRDERLGWTCDAQVFSSTANYHMDTRAFFRKFIHDLRCEQVKIDGAVPDFFPNLTGNRGASSVWGDIAAILPDNLYETYGSVELLEEAYLLMRDWVDWITRRDVERGQRYLYDFGFHYGDWLALDGATESSVIGGTDTGYIGSVYYYNSARLVERAASILGYADDQRRFGALAERIRQAILNEYFSPNGRLCEATQA